MPKGPAKSRWQRTGPIKDDEIRASYILGKDKIHPPGQHDMEHGFYETLIDGPFSSEAEAHKHRIAYKNSARSLQRRKKNGLDVAVNAWVEPGTLGTWNVRFRACCRECARAWLINKHGSDRSRWPYDPMRKRNANDYK